MKFYLKSCNQMCGRRKDFLPGITLEMERFMRRVGNEPSPNYHNLIQSDSTKMQVKKSSLKSLFHLTQQKLLTKQ